MALQSAGAMPWVDDAPEPTVKVIDSVVDLLPSAFEAAFEPVVAAVIEPVVVAAPAVPAVPNVTVPAASAVPAVPAAPAVPNVTVPAVPTVQAVPAVVESVVEAAPEEQAVSNGTVPAVPAVVRKTRIMGIPSLVWLVFFVIVIVCVSNVNTPPVTPPGSDSTQVVLAGPQTPVDPGEMLVQWLARSFAA